MEKKCESTALTLRVLVLRKFITQVPSVSAEVKIFTIQKCLLNINTPAPSLNSIHVQLLQSWPTLWDPMDHSPPGPSVHGIFPSKNTGVDCHVLLHVIFPIRGSKLPDPGIEPMSPVSPALQADSLLLRHLGSPSLTSILIAISTHYVGELIIVWCCKQWINNSKQTDC